MKISEFCDFGNWLDQMMHEHIICDLTSGVLEHKWRASLKLHYEPEAEGFNAIVTAPRNCLN